MNCNVHPNRVAVNKCEVCKQDFCEECLINVEGKFYCKEHVGVLLGRNNGQQYHNNNVPPNPPNYGNNGYGYESYNNNNRYDGHYSNPYGNQHGGPNINYNYYDSRMPGYYPYKNRLVALLLAIFLGPCGIHRFYAGKIGTGILWLCTGGLFGIGWIVDIITIALGGFRDGYGYPLI